MRHQALASTVIVVTLAGIWGLMSPPVSNANCSTFRPECMIPILSVIILSPECGDGTLDAGEDCDDGNTAAGDCCSTTCLFEPNGSACSDNNDCTADECQFGVCVGSCEVGKICGFICPEQLICQETGSTCECVLAP